MRVDRRRGDPKGWFTHHVRNPENTLIAELLLLLLLLLLLQMSRFKWRYHNRCGGTLQSLPIKMGVGRGHPLPTPLGAYGARPRRLVAIASVFFRYFRPCRLHDDKLGRHCQFYGVTLFRNNNFNLRDKMK